MISKDNHSIRQAFSDTLIELAKSNPNIFVVSADLSSSLTLDKFANKFRSRFVECGVAENNAAGVAAGLAKAGKTVFLATYACFSPGINWNTIKQSICYQNLNVKIVGSHGGLMTAELGATHQMLEDIAIMRTLPNMEVYAPLDATETVEITKYLMTSPSSAYLRLVRPSTPIFSKTKFIPLKAQVLCPGSKSTILGYGPILFQALSLNLPSVEIINCSSIKPLDSDTILKSIKKTKKCLVIEDHQKNGGLGEAVAALLVSSGVKCKFITLGIDNQFGQSAKDYQTLYDHYGIGKKSILKALNQL